MQALLGGRQFRNGIVFSNVGVFGGAAQRAGLAFVQMLALVFQGFDFVEQTQLPQ